MSDNKSTIEQLDAYVKEVFDKDGDGIISIKEIFSFLPNSAVFWIAAFVELAILIAEYRVADVGYLVTGSIFKAAGFVLVSAIPFYLGQVAWLYPRANNWQKAIGILFVLSGLTSSAYFGYSDLIIGVQKDALISYAPVMFTVIAYLTPCYVAMGLFYVLIDPVIRAKRMKVNTTAKAASEREMLGATKIILNELKEVINLKKQIVEELGGDSETGARLVDGQMNLMRGGKKKTVEQPASFQPSHQYAQTTNLPDAGNNDSPRPNS